MSSVSFHDLGLDSICEAISNDTREQGMIMSVLTTMCDDPAVASYRSEVFEDMLNIPSLRNQMTDLLKRIRTLKDFGIMRKEVGKQAGLWDLMHRIEEISEYITCVEEIRDCLNNNNVKSQGLKDLKAYVEAVYSNSSFDSMKKDISELKATTKSIQSVTIGINLNPRFEAKSIGLISVNDTPFVNSGIVSNLSRALSSKDQLNEGNEWNGDMHFSQVGRSENLPFKNMQSLAGFMTMASNPFTTSQMRQTLINVPNQDSGTESFPYYVNQLATNLLNITARKLKDILVNYMTVSVVSIANLIPEFMYYIHCAEFVEKLRSKGYKLCRAQAIVDKDFTMKAVGAYNIKLITNSSENSESIVPNDLDFSDEHTVYILTGANRGGKTTFTQAIGQLFALAQGGIPVPAESFTYAPVDCIYTHFPADEDKTMDLGRLGEECQRFKELFTNCTSSSLLLLNETFSTTSFEEGYYIAKDSVRAILARKIRTIYNTHMHKIARDIDELNSSVDSKAKAASLIVKTDGGKRSFEIVVAKPEGQSYTNDIASKYGVTYDQLTKSN